MESSSQKETEKAKYDPEKIFKGAFKKMEQTWGTAERKIHGEKGSLMDRCKDRIRRSYE